MFPRNTMSPAMIPIGYISDTVNYGLFDRRIYKNNPTMATYIALKMSDKLMINSECATTTQSRSIYYNYFVLRRRHYTICTENTT
ncbi:hypothetical protein F040043B6_22740 [Bacteroides uniformis]